MQIKDSGERAKLYLETDTGARVQIKEITSINPNSDILVFFVRKGVSPDDIIELQKRLTTFTNKRCVVLDDVFKETIYGI